MTEHTGSEPVSSKSNSLLDIHLIVFGSQEGYHIVTTSESEMGQSNQVITEKENTRSLVPLIKVFGFTGSWLWSSVQDWMKVCF